MPASWLRLRGVAAIVLAITLSVAFMACAPANTPGNAANTAATAAPLASNRDLTDHPPEQPPLETPAETPVENPPKEPAEKPPQEPPPAERDPADDVFTLAKHEGLFAGGVPASTTKVVILNRPNDESWVDDPAQDLPNTQRYLAMGLKLALEQAIDYLPQIHREINDRRVARWHALHRFSKAPRAGEPAPAGKIDTMELAAECFGADVVLLLSFRPAAGETPVLGQLSRYRRGQGFDKRADFELGALDKPEPGKHVRAFERAAYDMLSEFGAVEGKAVPHAKIPPLAADDKSLRDFARVVESFGAGEMTEAWIRYTDLLERDPACSRVALYAMEMFRALAQTQTEDKAATDYRIRSIKAGIEGLRTAPNDVMLRGRMAWNAYTDFRRLEWAIAELDAALKVQPGNMDLLNWKVMVQHWNDEDRTLQAGWLLKHAQDVVKDGRAELSIANVYFNAPDYAKGIEWYQRGLKLAPLDFELWLGLGLCGTYHAEALQKAGDEEGANNAFIIAAEAFERVQDIDPFEIEYAHEFYVRAATHKYTFMPAAYEAQERIFVSQAIMNGLTGSSRTWQFDRLVKDVIATWRRTTRETALSDEVKTKPFAERSRWYMARLLFAMVDNEAKAEVPVLWRMRREGIRPDMYEARMRHHRILVDEYKE